MRDVAALPLVAWLLARLIRPVELLVIGVAGALFQSVKRRYAHRAGGRHVPVTVFARDES